MHLFDLGLDAHFAGLVTPSEQESLGRVVETQKGGALVQTTAGTVWAKPRGRLVHMVGEAEAQPAVGDWVVLHGGAQIERILPRRTLLARQQVGEGGAEAQLIAANVDVVFLVMALAEDFNVRRLERYLATVWAGGAMPAVVLTKADLCADPARYLAQVRAAAPGVPVVVVSSVTGEGLAEVERLAETGKTVCAVGSSGVGKSTLVNRLMGVDVLATQGVRESDGKGRHTTTSRHLFTLPGGALMIDTPGMRELMPWDAESGVTRIFGDVEDFAAQCRFSDCRHETEPGCAVQAALEGGALTKDRFAAWEKLLREQAFQERRRDVKAQVVEREKWKKIHKEMRRKPRVKT